MLLDGGDAAGAVMEIAGYLASLKDRMTTEHQDWVYHNVACRAAMKAGDSITREEMVSLAQELERNPDVRYCPMAVRCTSCCAAGILSGSLDVCDMAENRIPVAAVVGPTATGKTELGIGLCQRLGGEVVSCDSMQVYRAFPLARPSPLRRSWRRRPITSSAFSM